MSTALPIPLNTLVPIDAAVLDAVRRAMRENLWHALLAAIFVSSAAGAMRDPRDRNGRLIR